MAANSRPADLPIVLYSILAALGVAGDALGIRILCARFTLVPPADGGVGGVVSALIS